VTVAGIDERAGDESPAVERLAIPGEREFVLGAALDVFPGECRDVAARDAPQFLDVQCATEVAPGIVAATRGGGLS
jgi:hypothetical protein